MLNFSLKRDDDYKNEIGKEENYLECCKQSVLYEIIDFEIILNKGLKGLKSIWRLDEYGHYIIDSIQY